MMTMISGRRCAVSTLAAACLAVLLTGSARADLLGEGDVLPGMLDTMADPDVWVIDLPIDGGDVGGDVVVGGTGETDPGTNVGRVVLDLPAFTDPVISESLIIGGLAEDVGFDGIGEVVVTGLGSKWTVNGELLVGHSGVGYLTVTSGAIIESDPDSSGTAVDADSTLGQFVGSQGFATVSGFGTKWQNDLFIIGNEGFGRVDVTTRARIETRDEAFIGYESSSFPSDGAMGTGHVVLDGQGTRWNIGDVNPNSTFGGTGDLTIGREGRGIVEVQNRALVAVERDVRIGNPVNTPTTRTFGQAYVTGVDSLLWAQRDLLVGGGTPAGELHVDLAGVARADRSIVVGTRGLVELAGGTLLTPSLTNDGIIRGSGRIDAAVVNNSDIRTTFGDRLYVTGTVENNDNITAIGGEMEFESLVTNNGPDGEIVVIDATLFLIGGVNNLGGTIYLDNAVVESPAPLVTAAALTLAASQSSLIGELELTNSNLLSVELGLGAAFSRLESTMAASIDGDLQIALSDNYEPRIGDSFEILQAQSLAGTFANVLDPGLSGIAFDVTYTGTSVLISVDSGFVFNADWDMDGTVTGLDLAIWNMNYGMMVAPGTLGDANGDGLVDGDDFGIWQQQLGTMPATPVSGAVPEPASGMLMAGVALAFAMRRRVK